MTAPQVGEARPLSTSTTWLLRTAVAACGACLLAALGWAGMRSVGADLGQLGLSVSVMRAVGRSAGLVAGALLMLQFVLSARLKLLDRIFGLDKLLRFHAVSGATAVSLAAIHPILLYATPVYELGHFSREQWPQYVGVLLLILLIVIAVTSIWRAFLALPYEAWKLIHKLAFAAVVLVSVHSLVLGSDLGGGWPLHLWKLVLAGWSGLFVWAKLIRPILLRRRRWTVESVTQVTHDTYDLQLRPPEGLTFRYLPGQFAFLTLSRQDSPPEEHPFTISSTPTRGEGISFTIKESGDFTATIGRTRPGDAATVDGPYGRFTHAVDARRSGSALRFVPFLAGGEEFVMIAGGVGITPVMSMLRYLRDAGDARRSGSALRFVPFLERPVVLIYGNKKERDIIFRDELDRMPPNVKIVHVLSRPDPDWKGESGFVTREIIEKHAGPRAHAADFYVCGPPPMMKVVVSALRSMGVGRNRIHHERFSL